MEIITIRNFACEAHGDQRYGDRPYIYHLEQVVAVLHRLGYRVEGDNIDPTRRADRLIAAGYLHDVLEDTPVNYDDLAMFCGHTIADLVLAVTNTPGTRRQRKDATFTRICAHPDGPELKGADRIANVENCIRTNSSLLKMYRREWPEFQQRLKPAGGSPHMWELLESLLEATPTKVPPITTSL